MGSITVTNPGKAYKLNFTVNPGEAIGINGAGKSTLLKMITGTTQTTTINGLDYGMAGFVVHQCLCCLGLYLFRGYAGEIVDEL